MKQARILAWLVVSLFVAALLCAAEEKKPVPTYTNEDLDRVRPFRDQTGVASTPAVAPEAPDAPEEPSGKARAGRAEAYWRREAERLRDRLRSLREKADALRLRIEQARRKPAGRARSRGGAQGAGPSTEALELRLRAFEAEIRERESVFEDRARREGALPGWLR